MKKMKITKSEERTLWSWWLVDRQENIYYIDADKPIYDGHVDLDKMVVEADSNETPTISSLISDGWRIEQSYKEFRMTFLCYEYEKVRKDDIDIEDIRRRFRERGWNASRRALNYCIDAWLKGVSSGFRDNICGVHTFIEGGDGPLRVEMSELDDLCKKWQITFKDDDKRQKIER